MISYIKFLMPMRILYNEKKMWLSLRVKIFQANIQTVDVQWPILPLKVSM